MKMSVLVILLMGFMFGLSMSARAGLFDDNRGSVSIQSDEGFEASIMQNSAPEEFNVPFTVETFQEKPWTQEFEYVIVVNKANSGTERQTVRVYRNQVPLQYEDIAAQLNAMTEADNLKLQQMQGTQVMSSSDGQKQVEQLVKDINERTYRLQELKTKMRAPGVFKISSGRDAFEKKGEHHSQKDSWTVTPAGWFVPQAFARKHKSESYSSKMCDSAFGKLIGAIVKKELCTYMEHAVFFNDAIALHKAIPGTEDALGEKASGGCIRMPGALAEYVYTMLGASKGQPVPAVQKSGEPKLDKNGDMIRETKHNSDWGTIDARSALIIVEEVVVPAQK